MTPELLEKVEIKYKLFQKEKCFKQEDIVIASSHESYRSRLNGELRAAETNFTANILAIQLS